MVVVVVVVLALIHEAVVGLAEVDLNFEAEEALVEVLVAFGNRAGELSTCNYLSEGSLLIQCPLSIFRSGVPANIDPRLIDNSQDLLINALRTLKQNPNELPVRPGFGTEGRPIKLRANFFPIKIRSSTYYEYDVALSPVAGTAIRRVKRRIFQLAEQDRKSVV